MKKYSLFFGSFFVFFLFVPCPKSLSIGNALFCFFWPRSVWGPFGLHFFSYAKRKKGEPWEKKKMPGYEFTQSELERYGIISKNTEYFAAGRTGPTGPLGPLGPVGNSGLVPPVSEAQTKVFTETSQAVSVVAVVSSIAGSIIGIIFLVLLFRLIRGRNVVVQVNPYDGPYGYRPRSSFR